MMEEMLKQMEMGDVGAPDDLGDMDDLDGLDDPKLL